MHIARNQLAVLVPVFLAASIIGSPGRAATVSFDQLNWFGLTTSTPDSSWGKVSLDYTGDPANRFFNLNVDGRWVVQNMVLASPFGAGVPQEVSTYFDLNVSHGTDVPSLSHVFTVEPLPSSVIPTGSSTAAVVEDLDFQIGGIGSIDLGSPGVLDRDFGGTSEVVVQDGHVTVVKEAKLRDFDKFVNQAVGINDCLRASVSNSLKYLQARNVLSERQNYSIERVRDDLGVQQDNTAPLDWARRKRERFTRIMTTNVAPTEENVDTILQALRRGHDVELDLRSHAINVVGMRVLSNGRVEIDVFDDNQREAGADGMKTYTIRNNRVVELGLNIRKFVIEKRKERNRPNNNRKKTNDAASRGNSVSFDTAARLLSFGGDVIVDTGFAGDPLVGVEVVMPLFELAEMKSDEVVFDRLLVDETVALEDGPNRFLAGHIATLTYVISENLFYGTLIDPVASVVDLASPLFDPGLAPIFSPYLQDLDRILNPNSPDHDPASMLYVTFEPDMDFFTVTNGFTMPALSPLSNFIFAGQEVPEPATLGLLTAGTLILTRRVRRQL